MIKNTANSGVYTDPAYRIAKSMYVALGGDPATEFESVDAIYAEINGIYESTGSRVNIEALKVQYNENGLYEFDNDEVTGYKPVSIEVAVAQKYTDEQVIELQSVARTEGYNNGYQDGFTTGSDDGYQDGYAEGLDDGFIDGVEDQKAKLTDITIDANGTYTAEDGYKTVTVALASTAEIDFSSLGYDANANKKLNENIADSIAYSKSIQDSYKPAQNMIRKYTGLMALEYFPVVDTSMVTQMNYMLSDTGLKYIPPLDCSSATSMTYICQNCYSLVDASFINTHNVTAFNYAFYKCQSLKNINIDTSGGQNMYQMFYQCKSLENTPLIDGSNINTATGVYEMFSGCSNLKNVQMSSIGGATNLYNMFYDCMALTEAPLFDTSKVTSFYNTFSNCQSLTSIPQYNTQSVTNFERAFSNCVQLTTIPLLDFGSATNVNYMLTGNTAITTLGGFKDLGKQSSLSGTNAQYFIYPCTKLTYESLMNVINNLYDRASNGLSVLTLKMHPDHIAKLSEADIAIATNKGWTIA